ncbi:peroxisomal sarcosine oxidase [Astyanax mexicanus]|uniref:peroxisomal sarcosine oxidase n=1 Tax=Astyanax mexicanus TaxID=7994 RepID=UPI0020CADDE4|nr:peroxisomal sarcosine oxidase [Astyanax mexicanus]
MASEEYDCIVIGAGIQGSFTAYHLAKNKKKTLLLDQFFLPHSRGSSHGQTRIIRKAYEEDFYVHMVEGSYELWARLEREAGVKLITRTGLLLMGPENAKDFQLVKSSMQNNGIPAVFLQRHEFSQHIPNVNLTPGDGALVETTAGVLFADRAVRAAQMVFQGYGGEIKDGQKVLQIEPGSVVTVKTGSGIYRAKSLVIAAGAWCNELLTHVGLQLPLQVLKINVCYWKEKVPGSYSVKNRFPCFIQLHPKEAENDIYGLPSNEYPGLMKLCYHSGSETNPDERDKQTDKSDVEVLSRYIVRCFPGLVPVPSVVESCMYTVTPDQNFVLDHHPTYRNIVIGAGFSGHGFKFSPVVGKVLSELSMGQVPSYDLSPFRIDRFSTQPKSAL